MFSIFNFCSLFVGLLWGGFRLVAPSSPLFPLFPLPSPSLPEKREPDDLRPAILATCSHLSRLPTLLMKDSKQYQPHAALWWHRAAALRAPHVSSTFGHLQSDPHVAQQELKDNLQRVPSFHVSVCRFFLFTFLRFRHPRRACFSLFVVLCRVSVHTCRLSFASGPCSITFVWGLVAFNSWALAVLCLLPAASLFLSCGLSWLPARAN